MTTTSSRTETRRAPATSSRHLAVCGSLLSSLLSLPSLADKSDDVLESSDNPLATPFAATVKPSFVHVYLRPETNSPEVGLLREGAEVIVTSCQPDCATPHAWASLGTDGAVRLDLLNPKPIAIETPTQPTAESLWYGVVGNPPQPRSETEFHL